jgi:hypothetical protein
MIKYVIKRCGRLGRYLMLGEAYDIDMSDIGHITLVGRVYICYVNGVKYGTTFNNTGVNDWEIVFGNMDKNDKINIKMLNTSTYTTAKEIMTNVAKSIIMFIRLKNPRSIRYVTDTKNRVIAYKRLFNVLSMKPEIMGYHFEEYDNNLHYIIKNTYSLDNIITKG